MLMSIFKVFDKTLGLLASLLSKFLIALCLLAIFTYAAGDQDVAYDKVIAESYILTNAAESSEDLKIVIGNLQEVSAINPEREEAYQLMGAIYLLNKQPLQAIDALQMAIQLNGWNNPIYLANLVEGYRMIGDFSNARLIGEQATSIFPQDFDLVFNFALAEKDARNFNEAIKLALQAAQIDPSIRSDTSRSGGSHYNRFEAWEMAIQLTLDHDAPQRAETIVKAAMALYPSDSKLLYFLGTSLHLQNRVEEAITIYLRCQKIDPAFHSASLNLGAAYQGLGRAEEAKGVYEQILPFMGNDAGFLNNYGALLGIMGDHEGEIKYLERALAIDATLQHTLINLAGFYQDNMNIPRAVDSLITGAASSPDRFLMALRVAIMLSVISNSWEQMVFERLAMEEALLVLLNHSKIITKRALGSVLDRIPFYIVYHCLNDRFLQELISLSYSETLYNINYISPNVINIENSLSGNDNFGKQHKSSSDRIQDVLASYQKKGTTVPNYMNKKVRVAFISKYFGLFEPHGLLLDGVMRSLPRSHFTVIALPIARTDGKPLGPNVIDGADIVFEISLMQSHATEQVANLDVDILVFADILSEPMNHFLAHSRLARTQLAFWGNPVTSASLHIDYFISGAILEHPYRTRMAPSDDPYTEQVVLLEGQGIWYYPPSDPLIEIRRANLDVELRKIGATRAEFGLGEDWFIFLCPQSTFKIHPLFDDIFAQILKKIPQAHLMVLGGRRPKWTDLYTSRVISAIGIENKHRFHFIDRVSSERFIGICQLADVILHPFPFDGSRTSADSLIAGVPFVTLPSEYLRGRMGVAFLRTMNLPELAAKNATHYVDICVGLYKNTTLLADLKIKIRERLHLIWEDMEYVYSWVTLFSTLSNIRPVISWDNFILENARNLTRETELRDERRRNQRIFDLVWGSESHLLEDGVATLETFIDDPTYVPRIFSDWGKSATLKSLPSSAHRFTSLADRIDSFWNNPNKAKQHNSTIKLFKFLNSTPGMQFNVSHFDSIWMRGDVKGGKINNDLLEKVPAYDDSSKYPHTTRAAVLIAPTGGIEGDFNTMDLFRSLVKRGMHEDAQHLAMENLVYNYNNDPLFNIEFGVLQIFRGRYQDGHTLCKRAALLSPSSTLAHGCIGVAGTHLGIEEGTLEALYTAWQLSKETHASDTLTSELFNLDDDSLEFNVLSALKTFKRFQECCDIFAASIDFQGNTDELFIVASLSFIDWSDDKQYILSEFENALRRRNILSMKFNKGNDLLTEIRSFQNKSKRILNPAYQCIDKTISRGFYEEVMADIAYIIHLDQENPPPSSFQFSSEIDKLEKVVLITQVFLSNDPLQMKGVQEALTRNLKNPYISDVITLSEQEYGFERLPYPWKLKQYVMPRRLTFQEAFKFADSNFPGRIIAVTNADIFFDDTLSRICKNVSANISAAVDLTKKVFALGTWSEVDSGDGSSSSLSISFRTDSQDAWIYRSPMDECVSENASFFLGAVRADNVIAQILTDCGYNVTNPMFGIRAIESDLRVRYGNLYDLGGAAYGDMSNVYLSDKTTF